MSQTNDLEYTALGLLGFEGSLNDRELAWLQGEGATSNQLNDAWLEVIATTAINDGKLAYFLANGGTGDHINDAENSFWLQQILDNGATLWYDTFTDTNAVTMPNHTPDEGGTYTTVGTVMNIQSNTGRATGSLGTSPVFYGALLNGLILPVDYDIKCDFIMGNATAFSSCLGFWSDVTGVNRIAGCYNSSVGAIGYDSYDTSVSTPITGDLIPHSIGTVVSMTVEIRGDNATIRMADAAPLSFTRPAHLTGLNEIMINVRNSNGNPKIDNLLIIDRVLAPAGFSI